MNIVVDTNIVFSTLLNPKSAKLPPHQLAHIEKLVLDLAGAPIALLGSRYNVLCFPWQTTESPSKAMVIKAIVSPSSGYGKFRSKEAVTILLLKT